MFEKFTSQARQVVVGSQEQARAFGHPHIGTEHLLLALLHLPEDAPARAALDATGITIAAAEAGVLEAVPRGAGQVSGHIPFTPRAKRVLELSFHESQRLGSAVIGPEHVLLGLLDERDGVAAQVLLRDGRTDEQVRAAVATTTGTEPIALLSVQSGEPNHTPATTQVLTLAEQLAGGAPVGSQHLLEALAWVEDGIAGRVLTELGVTRESVADAVDGIDAAATTDMTPDVRGLVGMRLTVDGDTVVLTSTDLTLVGIVRKLVEDLGGDVSAEGPLAGAFVPLHQALVHTARQVFTAVNPPADAPHTAHGRALRERLKRRREG